MPLQNELDPAAARATPIPIQAIARGAQADDDIESTLGRLSKYGNPTLMLAQRGWWCYINIHVTAVGAKFEIKSESDHKFPKHAALECESRMMTALRSIGAA